MRARMLLAVFLAILIGLSAPAFGQQPAPAQAATAPAAAAETLKILVLQGQNAINSIAAGAATTPVVEIHDENDLPLEGADVVFELPATGAGGTFPGGQFTKSVKSNLQGQAGAAFMLNPVPGRFAIKVSASLRNRTGHTTIPQTNVLEVREKSSGHGIGKWKWVIIAGAAATVAVVIVAVTRGGSSSSSNTITLTPGSPTFGTP